MKISGAALFLMASFAAAQDTAQPPPPAKTAEPVLDAELAACRQLDTSQRDECELKVRQGLDEDESGTAVTAAAEPDTPPTDQVPVEDDDER